jgi:hypothetical protein
LKPDTSFNVFKRNQIEEAIQQVLEPKTAEPSTELRTRIKRLLETDRALGRTVGSNTVAGSQYAFYSDDAPGSGVEVWFSGCEAFALLIALYLLTNGWPQTFAVSVLRRIRCELEKEHGRILRQDPKVLFDQRAIRANAKAGDMAVNNTDPVFLVMVTKSGAARNEDDEAIACAIRRGPGAAMKWAWQASEGVGVHTLLELVNLAHKLAAGLTRTEPKARGRSA